MKKRSLSDALAEKNPAAPAQPASSARLTPPDDRITTTLRISHEGLVALKHIAAERRIRVNDMLLEGAEHVLALNGKKMQLRK